MMSHSHAGEGNGSEKSPQYAHWLQPRTRDVELLHKLADGLVDCTSMERVAHFVGSLLLEQTPGQSCSLMLLDHNSGDLTIAGGRSRLAPPADLSNRISPQRPFKLGEGIAGWVAGEQIPVRLEEAPKDTRFLPLSSSRVVVNSLISFPLVHRGTSIGVINLSSPAPGVFTEEDERLMSVASRHIASGLVRTKYCEELEKANSRLGDEASYYRNRLTQAEKMSTVGNLLAGIVHELNNPLTTVLGFSQLLLREEERGGSREILEKIASESERCARIVQNLLGISRPGSFEREVVHVNRCIQHAASLMEYQLRVANISLTVELSRESPRIVARPVQLTQVLLNLITNAVQAIAGSKRDGTIRISSSVEYGRVFIDVADNGPGIKEADLSFIFEPFFTTKETGTGLGLSLTKEIVGENGGNILVSTSKGGGAQFRVDFPAAAEGIDAEPEGSDSNRSRTSTRKQSILVVDDEQHIVDLIEGVLGELGHQVDCADSGENAVEKLRDTDYDLVISDLRMPGIGGLELIEWIRSANKPTRILLLSGDVASRETEKLARASAIHYLSKPFRIEELIDAVNRAVSRVH